MKETIRRNISNYITCIRFLCVLGLALTITFSTPFFIFYLFAGISDILDGFLARKLKIESELGARLDSLADFSFLLVCMIKVFPLVYKDVNAFLWIVLAIIFIMKIISIITIVNKTGNFGLLHTYAAKFNGVLLFLGPALIHFLGVNQAGVILGIFCFYGGLEELIIVLMSKNIDFNIKSMFNMS